MLRSASGRDSSSLRSPVAAHEKRQTDKYATKQWQKSCNFHIRLATLASTFSSDGKGDGQTTILVLKLSFTIVKYNGRRLASTRTACRASTTHNRGDEPSRRRRRQSTPAR